MNKVLITVSNSSVARNILRSNVLRLLAAESSVVIVTSRDKHETYRQEFEPLGVRVFASPHSVPSLPERVLSFLARNAFYTETIGMWQNMELQWNHRYGLYVIKRILFCTLGRSRLFHSLLRFLHKKLPSSKKVIRFLHEVKPDLLFVADAFGDIDVVFWQAAARLELPTMVMVRSWDNLSNHGLLRMVPEHLIVHNPFLKRLAMELHHIPEQKITIVGLPHYDWYVHDKLFLSREEFFKKIGADSGKKLVLFAGIGDYLAPHDSEVAEVLSNAIERKELTHPVQALFRPHPAFSLANRQKLSTLPHFIFDDRVHTSEGGQTKKGEMDAEDMAHLMNSLKHADLVITTASTMAIDAVAFDKPVVCIAFDGKSSEPYWNSVARYYQDFTHYKIISQTGGFRIAWNPDELIQSINAYLENPSLDQEGRKKIFNDFIWKLDGRSAERLANILLRK